MYKKCIYILRVSQECFISDDIDVTDVVVLYKTTACIIMNLGYHHYNDVIMGVVATQITSLTIVYSTVESDPDRRKHQNSTSLAFVRGIHRGPVNSQHKWAVTRKMFPFDDVIMRYHHDISVSNTNRLHRVPPWQHHDYHKTKYSSVTMHNVHLQELGY